RARVRRSALHADSGPPPHARASAVPAFWPPRAVSVEYALNLTITHLDAQPSCAAARIKRQRASPDSAQVRGGGARIQSGRCRLRPGSRGHQVQEIGRLGEVVVLIPMDRAKSDAHVVCGRQATFLT